jgi:Post-segregation antitoxin CcdA
MPKLHLNVSLEPELYAKARAKNINMSQATERGVIAMLNESLTPEEKLLTETDKLLEAQLKISDAHNREIIDAIKRHYPLTEMGKKALADILKTEKYKNVTKSLDELIVIAEQEIRNGDNGATSTHTTIQR